MGENSNPPPWQPETLKRIDQTETKIGYSPLVDPYAAAYLPLVDQYAAEAYPPPIGPYAAEAYPPPVDPHATGAYPPPIRPYNMPPFRPYTPPSKNLLEIIRDSMSTFSWNQIPHYIYKSYDKQRREHDIFATLSFILAALITLELNLPLDNITKLIITLLGKATTPAYNTPSFIQGMNYCLLGMFTFILGGILSTAQDGIRRLTGENRLFLQRTLLILTLVGVTTFGITHHILTKHQINPNFIIVSTILALTLKGVITLSLFILKWLPGMLLTAIFGDPIQRAINKGKKRIGWKIPNDSNTSNEKIDKEAEETQTT